MLHICMCFFGDIIYVMLPDERRGKFDAKGIKYVFLEYCEGMKVYRPMCLETKRDIMFMKDSGSIRNDLEMRPNGKIQGPTMVVVVDNPWMSTSKWEVMELQLKRHVKDRQTTTLLLRDSARSGFTPQGSSNRLEDGGRIIICLNVVTNMPMWQYLKPL